MSKLLANTFGDEQDLEGGAADEEETAIVPWHTWIISRGMLLMFCYYSVSFIKLMVAEHDAYERLKQRETEATGA